MHNQAIETIIDGQFKLEIFQDDNAESPDDWDSVGKIIESRRHIENVARELVRENGSFWYREVQTQDRGYRFYIVPKNDWTKEGSPRATGQAYCNSMAKTWEQYYDGDIYGYVVSVKSNGPCDCEDWEEKDSCWGYYGMENVLKEGKSVMAGLIKTEKQAIDFEHNGMAI